MIEAKVSALRAAPRDSLKPETRRRLADNEKANADIRHIDALLAENKAILKALRAQRIEQVAIANYSIMLALEAEEEAAPTAPKEGA